jgi:hypothetical protein
MTLGGELSGVPGLAGGVLEDELEEAPPPVQPEVIPSRTTVSMVPVHLRINNDDWLSIFASILLSLCHPSGLIGLIWIELSRGYQGLTQGLVLMAFRRFVLAAISPDLSQSKYFNGDGGKRPIHALFGRFGKFFSTPLVVKGLNVNKREYREPERLRQDRALTHLGIGFAKFS